MLDIEKKMEEVYEEALKGKQFQTCVNVLVSLHEIGAMDNPIADNRLSASEAVYGFCAWMSPPHDCGQLAKLAKRFCEMNKLTGPREDWAVNFTHPTD